jgi:hypothetical protein
VGGQVGQQVELEPAEPQAPPGVEHLAGVAVDHQRADHQPPRQPPFACPAEASAHASAKLE